MPIIIVRFADVVEPAIIRNTHSRCLAGFYMSSHLFDFLCIFISHPAKVTLVTALCKTAFAVRIPLFDKYCIGYSADLVRRSEKHNKKLFNTFTSKYRPWELAAYFQCSDDEGETIKMDKWIKKQKSRKLIERLCDPSFVPTGILAQLIRVPQVRD